LFVDTVAALAVGVVGYLAFRSRRRHFIRSR
jgi:MYXO-CTERM domain-containing protein